MKHSGQGSKSKSSSRLPRPVFLSGSKKKYQELINHAPVAIFEVDFLKECFTSVNDEMCRITGYSAKELLKVNIFSILDEKSKSILRERITQWLKGDRPPENIEYKIISKTGKYIYAELKTSFQVNKQGRPIGAIVIAHDITEMKLLKDSIENAAEEKSMELIRAMQELERAKRLSDIGFLASTVAHELRNPLAAITMAVANIKRKAKNPELDRNIETISNKIAESEQIINNLLFYTKLRPPKLEKIDLYRIIEECINNAEKQYKSKNKIVGRLGGLKRFSMSADPLQLKEVFSNLLNNAFDAIEGKSGKIEVGFKQTPGFVHVYISDNGYGISKDDLENIFNPFFTTKAQGTGLGLTICSQIIKLHGGQIEIESRLNKGTRVTMVLPTSL